MGMDQYLLISFLGDEHPFTSYSDVHQGYKVLTHCHMEKKCCKPPVAEKKNRASLRGVGHTHEAFDAHLVRDEKMPPSWRVMGDTTLERKCRTNHLKNLKVSPLVSIFR